MGEEVRMKDKFDERLEQYYQELGKNEIEIRRLNPLDDEALLKELEIHKENLRKSITEAKLLYDNFLQKLDEIMPEI